MANLPLYSRLHPLRVALFTGLAAWLTLGLEAQAPAPATPNPVLRRKSLPAYTGPHALSGHDRADLRREYDRFWFGQQTPEFLDHRNRVAAEQLQRWNHLLPARDRVKALAAPGAAFAPLGVWVNLGPTSNLTPAGWSSVDSGRPVAILPHPTIPTTVYVATSGGGVFRCTNAQLDGGDWVWTPITDNLPANSSSGNVALGALAMSPTDSNVLYLGAGDFFDAEGRGFFRSTDAGATWTAAAGLGAATRSFAILPLTATRIFWATNDGLKVSIDGGVSFAAVAGGPSTGNIWSIQKFNNLDLVCSKEITDANNNTISTIYTSADSGATWTAAALPANLGFTPGRITLVASLNNTVYGMVENTSSNNVIGRGVLKSTDKGVTWTWMAAPTVAGGLFQGTGRQMTSDGGQGWYNHGLAVDPTNANRLVMGSNLAMYRSTDGGASWTQLSHWFGNLHPYSHADFHTGAWSGGTLFMGNDGGISILRDPWRVTVPSGEDITFLDNRRNKGLPSHLVYHLGSTIAAAPADSRWRITLGMQDNGTRVRQGSNDALKASSVFEDQIGGDGFGTLIHATNGNLMLGSVYYSRVCKSTDGGATFIESTAGITEANDSANAPFKTRLMPGPANEPDTVYTFANKKVYRSTDFGNNWNALTMTDFVNSGKVIRNLAGSRRSNA
ncbi:MAG: hypothetical protein LWX11_01910, partial [Firmicutes bacterium]|nr:hypothetical protein [Bacillota bacterium]